jgi:hypothetical protein
MDVICSERDCRRAATATKAVRLTKGRDKSQLISIWVCEVHLRPDGEMSPPGQIIGEARASREIAI